MIRRFLTRILITALIAICGYNWYQINTLRDEVAALQRQVQNGRHTESNASEAKVGPDWLSKANRHIENARAAVGKSDFQRARQELLKSFEAIHQAVLQPQVHTKTALAEFYRKLADLQLQADDLWRKTRPKAPAGAQ